jgi:hypothetical protein
LIPVLYEVTVEDLPADVAKRKAIDYHRADFYDLLEKAVKENIRTEDSLPAGDVGVGLAWSFFLWLPEP